MEIFTFNQDFLRQEIKNQSKSFQVGRSTLNLGHLLLAIHIKDREEGSLLSLPDFACCRRQVHFFTVMRAYFFGIPVTTEEYLGYPASWSEQLLDSCNFHDRRSLLDKLDRINIDSVLFLQLMLTNTVRFLLTGMIFLLVSGPYVQLDSHSNVLICERHFLNLCPYLARLVIGMDHS